VTPEKVESLLRRAAKRGVGVRETCRRAGINYSTVKRWKAGTMEASAPNFFRLRRAVLAMEGKTDGQ